ncbi:AsnC family transcriptional regulator, partial [Brucella intermedia M86]
EVFSCHLVSGESDFLLQVVVADLAAYERFLSGTLLRLPGVIDIRSNFAIQTVKSQGEQNCSECRSRPEGAAACRIETVHRLRDRPPRPATENRIPRIRDDRRTPRAGSARRYGTRWPFPRDDAPRECRRRQSGQVRPHCDPVLHDSPG